MKETWTENDVLELIKNGTPESLTLDYKRIDSLGNNDKKKNELSKDVSAFANSAGGTLIYGVIEDKNVPISIDGGVDPKVITKEWIEQVINSRIQRRIPNILIHQIPLSVSNNVIYVIDIPQSHQAPHMAADKKFYKRFNFESIPMEEYEVRDVSNRISTPNLNLELHFIHNHLTYRTSNNYTGFNPFVINLTNSSVVPLEYAYFQFFIDKRLKIPDEKYENELRDTNGHNYLNIKGKKIDFYSFFTIHHISSGLMPVFKGITFPLDFGVRKIALPKNGDTFYIVVQIASTGLEPQEFIFEIVPDGDKILVNKINKTP